MSAKVCLSSLLQVMETEEEPAGCFLCLERDRIYTPALKEGPDAYGLCQVCSFMFQSLAPYQCQVTVEGQRICCHPRVVSVWGYPEPYCSKHLSSPDLSIPWPPLCPMCRKSRCLKVDDAYQLCHDCYLLYQDYFLPAICRSGWCTRPRITYWGNLSTRCLDCYQSAPPCHRCGQRKVGIRGYGKRHRFCPTCWHRQKN